MGPPGPGELCPEDLGWILCDTRRGLERRPQRGQPGIQSGSGAKSVATLGRGGGPARPWPHGPQATASAPSPVTTPEVPGCGLRLTAEGRGLCEVSMEPAPRSKPLGPCMGLSSLLPPGRGRVARPAGRSGGFPPGRGGHRPSVDSSQRRKPAGMLGARPGPALPSPGPAVSAAPREEPAAPGGLAPCGEGSSPPEPPPALSHPSPPAIRGKWPQETQDSGHPVGLSEAVSPQTRWLGAGLTARGSDDPRASISLHPAQTHSSLGVSWHSEVPHPTLQARKAGSTETLECWSGQAVPEPSLRLWLARAFRKPGPGPGLDRTSWFSSRPENMRRWPSVLAVRPGPVGGAGRPPLLGRPGLSSLGAGLGGHVGAQLGCPLA